MQAHWRDWGRSDAPLRSRPGASEFRDGARLGAERQSTAAGPVAAHADLRVRRARAGARDAAGSAPRAVDEGRRAALVAGDPGSGKSRLVRELAHEVSAEGATVLYGDCDGVVGSPYGPFAAALEHLVRHTDPETLRLHLGAGGPELTRLLPEPRGASATRRVRRRRTRTRSATGCTPPSPPCSSGSARSPRCCSCSRTCTGPTRRRCS